MFFELHPIVIGWVLSGEHGKLSVVTGELSAFHDGAPASAVP